MEQFPDTEVFYVNWIGGTSGAFICSLLGDLVYGPAVHDPSENGNSHSGLDRLGFNQVNVFPDDFVHPPGRTPFIHKYACPKDSNIPLIIFEHEPPDWDTLFKKFPKCKHVIVTYSVEDTPRVRGNMFFKTTAEWFDPTDLDSNWNKLWYEMKQEFSTELTDIDHPRDLPHSVGEKALGIPYIPEFPFLDGSTYPAEYADQIIPIKLYDIIHNRQVVLDQLAEITGRPVTPEIEQAYIKYQDAQSELVRTKMPWVKV
jgi:hypothetical protein